MDDTEKVEASAPPAGGGRAGSLRGALRLIRESVAGTPQDFAQGSLGSAVFLPAMPMVLEMLMESLLAVAAALMFRRGRWKVRKV